MDKTLFLLFKEVRPRQWLKNLCLFVAVFFTGELLNFPVFVNSLLAFFVFCAASSSSYILNDLMDIEKDKLHPFKKNRPLASGKLPKELAIFTGIILTIFALTVAFKISLPFLVIVLLFYILQISYSLFLKHIMLLDILTIASGFILRVFAGDVATGYHIDIWLFLTVVSVSLFIAIGKRRSELTLISAWENGTAAKTRVTLTRYSEKMLDVYLSMFANSAWITYAFYTFLQRTTVIRRSLSSIIEDRKWMMVTIPVVIYGIMRYLQLIYEKNVGESPEKVLLSDKPLMITAALLGSSLFTIIYIIAR